MSTSPAYRTRRIATGLRTHVLRRAVLVSLDYAPRTSRELATQQCAPVGIVGLQLASLASAGYAEADADRVWSITTAGVEALEELRAEERAVARGEYRERAANFTRPSADAARRPASSTGIGARLSGPLPTDSRPLTALGAA